jgi:hypothetical protein
MRKPAAAFPEPARWPGSIQASLPTRPGTRGSVLAPLPTSLVSSEPAAEGSGLLSDITALPAHGVRLPAPSKQAIPTSHFTLHTSHFSLLTSHFSLPSPHQSSQLRSHSRSPTEIRPIGPICPIRPILPLGPLPSSTPPYAHSREPTNTSHLPLLPPNPNGIASQSPRLACATQAYLGYGPQ